MQRHLPEVLADSVQNRLDASSLLVAEASVFDEPLQPPNRHRPHGLPFRRGILEAVINPLEAPVPCHL